MLNGELIYSDLFLKFLIIALDYFTKWIEFESLVKITERKIFIWKNIVRQFGISKVIISDNAKQFDNDGFKKFCSRSSSY